MPMPITPPFRVADYGEGTRAPISPRQMRQHNPCAIGSGWQITISASLGKCISIGLLALGKLLAALLAAWYLA